jgi:hypothetical protein
MVAATFASIHLARFETLRAAGPLAPGDRDGVLFRAVAADTRAAATEPASQQAFKFLLFALHDGVDSAHRLFEERYTYAPWLREACEVWSGVLRPFRHMGTANYLDRREPGPLFDPAIEAPAGDGPVLVTTSSGWVVDDALDMNRVREFSNGVAAVRMAMSGIDGLHSQQSFFYPRVLEYDPMTVTFWRNAASLRAFAYGPGVHRMQMERQREQNLADRTSFTRYSILRSEGTWHGTDPCDGAIRR